MVTVFLKLCCCAVLFIVSLFLLTMSLVYSTTPLGVLAVFVFNFISISLFAYIRYRDSLSALHASFVNKKTIVKIQKTVNIAA